MAEKKNGNGRPRYTLGERLRAWRELRGLTQAEVGAALGLAQADISRYESGEIEVRASLLPAYAGVLRTSIEDLYRDPPAQAVG